MKLASKIENWTAMIDATLARGGFVRSDILTGRDAWTIAHRAGVTEEAYSMGRDITDGHIQTALQKIMPNAVFKDKKVY